MTYTFKKFEQTNGRFETRLTITRSKHIGLPTQFYKDNSIADYKYAVLYYDKENSAVALRFTNDEAETGRFSIMRSGQGYGGSVIATSFFKANKIDTSRYAGRYEWEKKPLIEVGLPGEGNLFIVALKDKGRGLMGVPG
jgi:hypothetical protein